MFIKLVHETSCATLKVWENFKIKFNYKKLLSRLMNGERVENTLLATPVDPL